VDSGGQDVDAGGAAAFAAALNTLRAGHPHTLTACAGDLIGASPLLSAMFHDEPTIEAMDLLKLDLCAVGNHEFDEGQDELLRIQGGGCHPVDGCVGKQSYAGAGFQFLGANVVIRGVEQTLLPPYAIREFGGVKVGFIGLTLEATPRIVSAGGVANLRFEDEIEVINRYAAEIKAQGVATIIVLIHEGGVVSGEELNGCNELDGAIVPIARGVDPAVVALVTGHSHQLYNCVVEGRVVTSAKSYGRAITAIDLVLDPDTGETRSIKALNHAVSVDIEPDGLIMDLIARYRALAGPLLDEVIGNATVDLTRAEDASGQSDLGLIIADAHLDATAAPPASAQLAFTNVAGIRDSVRAGDITYAQLHSAQPFGNTLITISLTGAQLEALLEEQLTDPPYNILQPSRTLRYAWSASAPEGDKIDPASITIGSAPLDLTATYRVTVNSYLASGGDGFTYIKAGTDHIQGPEELKALRDHLRANSPLSPPPHDRITLLP
jgi:5'-nucleotidase